MREFQPSLERRRRGERPGMVRLLAAVALAAALPLAAYANGVVQSMKGDVRAGPVGQTARTVAVDQRLTPGTAVVTGADAQVVLRFDDGQQVVLNQNTEFRIVDFRYDASDAKVDRTVFDLIKGALRMASGAIVGRNRQAVALPLPMPQALWRSAQGPSAPSPLRRRWRPRSRLRRCRRPLRRRSAA
ncbi:MAG: FecR domain-containing protein [Betaproteobacteria bacterium]|nr:MAG: FecR domain-containing protein [Betaproteobacteria bacterium]